MIYTDDEYVLNILKKRAFDAHKGNFGKVLIFAGSLGMAGAAVLCGKAALLTGSGLVRFLLPDIPCDILPVLQTCVPEATCIGYHSDMDYNEYDAIACGSGLGRDDTARKILTAIVQNYGRAAHSESSTKILILDADALNMIAESPPLQDAMRNSEAEIIITPHIGEAKRLLNTCAGITSFSDRKNAVCDLAEKFNCTAILKGAGTLVACKNPPKNNFLIFENTTGNPGMATAGSGDTLTGIITSLAGQGYPPLDAARLGVFFHGKAGDIAADELGEMSVTAGAIGEYLPHAIKRYYDRIGYDMI